MKRELLDDDDISWLDPAECRTMLSDLIKHLGLNVYRIQDSGYYYGKFEFEKKD